MMGLQEFTYEPYEVPGSYGAEQTEAETSQDGVVNTLITRYRSEVQS